MKILTRSVLFLIMLLTFISCGVITKIRYKNGYKPNLNVYLFEKKDKKDNSFKKVKNNKTVSIGKENKPNFNKNIVPDSFEKLDLIIEPF